MRLITTIITLLIASQAFATVVRFETDYGNIDIEMNELLAPLNVAGFLEYVQSGAYDNSQIHRSAVGTLIQGGEFVYDGTELTEIPENAQVVNEFNVSNSRGTLAMAKLPNQPNSATNNWYININDNTSFDTQNGGFTVVGNVIRGMDVVDNLNSLRVINPFTGQGQDLRPFSNFQTADQFITLDNFVYINKAFVLSEQFQITPGLSGAWFNPDTNGQGIYLEVLPSVNTLIMAWFAFDTEHPDASVPSTIGAAGNRWLTASGDFQGNQFVGSVFKTSGGLFDNPTAVSNINIGDITLTFIDCGLAEMSYVLDDSGLTNTINIQRISGSNIDFCEQLSIEADQGVITQ